MGADCWKLGKVCDNELTNPNNLRDDDYTHCFYRNPVECIEFPMQQPAFREHMLYAPAEEFNDAEECIYSVVKSSDWCWKEQVHGLNSVTATMNLTASIAMAAAWNYNYPCICQFRAKEILQTIRGTRRNSRYIWVSETSTQQLYQTLRILHASFLPFLLCLRNITLKDMEGHLPWWNNRSTIMKFSGMPSRLFLVLSMNFSTLECLCFTQTVRWGNVILLSLHGQLITSNTFTCTRWSGPIAVCAKQQNCHLEKGIHRLSNWETSSYTSRWWYLWLKEMRWRDRRQHNIWKLEWLEPQMVSSEIWNASPQRGIVPDILHTVNLGILKHLMICVTFLFKQHSSIDEFNQLWAMMPPYPSSTQFNKPYRQMTQWSRNEINAHGRVIDQVFAVTLVNHSARHKIPFTEA